MRDIVKVCERTSKVVPKADESLMVEAKRDDEIESSASLPITIKGPDTLNQSRGVV